MGKKCEWYYAFERDRRWSPARPTGKSNPEESLYLGLRNIFAFSPTCCFSLAGKTRFLCHSLQILFPLLVRSSHHSGCFVLKGSGFERTTT